MRDARFGIGDLPRHFQLDRAFGVAGVAGEEGVEVVGVVAWRKRKARADGAEDDVGGVSALHAEEFGELQNWKPWEHPGEVEW